MISQVPGPVPKQKVMVYMNVGNTHHAEIKTMQEPTKSKTAIYCRTASIHPDDFLAIWQQRDIVCAFAFERGYETFKIYSDDGYSGLNLDRPAFAEMEEDMAAGKIDTIIVSCVDRIARDFILRENWISKLKLKGICLIAADGSHEPTMPCMLEIVELMKGKKSTI